jgi:Rrf2 family protein
MKISKRGEYGVRALCHLAGRQGQGLTHIREIADSEDLPCKFLEGILLALKRAGFVKSRRGNEGGYALARSAETIMLGDVLRALDGPLAPMGSASELSGMMDRYPERRGFYRVLLEVRNAVSRILDHTSIADITGHADDVEVVGADAGRHAPNLA